MIKQDYNKLFTCTVNFATGICLSGKLLSGSPEMKKKHFSFKLNLETELQD
jgi:hypothetical protein